MPRPRGAGTTGAAGAAAPLALDVRGQRGGREMPSPSGLPLLITMPSELHRPETTPSSESMTLTPDSRLLICDFK